MERFFKIYDIIKKLMRFLSQKERLVGVCLLFLMSIGAALESASVGLLVPVIQLINEPALITKSKKLNYLYETFHFESARQFSIYLLGGLIVVFVLKNIYSLGLFHLQAHLLHLKKLSLIRFLFSKYMSASYTFFLHKNSAELIRNINYVGRFADSVCMSVIALLSELMVVAVLMGLMFWYNYKVTFIVIGALGSLVFLFHFFTDKKILAWAQSQTFENLLATKWLNQALGGIKEIKVLGKEDFFLNTYLKHMRNLSETTKQIHVLNQLPKPFVELIVMSGLVGYIIFNLAQNVPVQDFMPLIVLFAAVSYRLLPSINKIMAASLSLREGGVVIDVLSNSIQEAEGSQNTGIVVARDPNLTFSKFHTLHIENLTFRYSEKTPFALDHLNLSLVRGSSLGIVGHSGAGKSTLVDILLGLLNPVSGDILADDASIFKNLSAWRKNVGYVPQSIFLTDDTIRRNIAFGIADKDIDDNRVEKVISMAQLGALVTSLENGVNTLVGERGVRISGGERQRIGIARALYHDPEILILDEATSALDNETERAISSSIERLKGEKTLIIIAHRLSTVRKCDELVFLRKGIVIGQGSYDRLLETSKEFNRLVVEPTL